MKGSTIFASIVTALFFSAAAMAPAAAKNVRVLKFASIQATGQPSYKGMEKMAEIVSRRTHGQLKLQLFADSQLGTEQQSIEGVQFGTIDMYMGSSGALSTFLPSLEAFSAPYIWRSVHHMMDVVRGPIGEELNTDLIAKTGIRILDMGWYFGARDIATRKIEVHKPADLNGQKIRMQPTNIYIAAMKAMGANVIPMDFKEVYTSLQTGVIDGLDNPPNVYAARSMWEVVGNLSLTRHILQNQVVIINNDLFESLKPEWRKILVDAAREAGNYQNKLTIDGQKKALAKMAKNGMKIVKPDIAAFKAATADVYKQFEGNWKPGLYERIKNTH